MTTQQVSDADQGLVRFTIGTDEPARTVRIPDPPAGMFTKAEWARIQRLREIREANGTNRVGDDY